MGGSGVIENDFTRKIGPEDEKTLIQWGRQILKLGFCFSSIVEVDLIKESEVGGPARFFEPIFYICAAVGLALALYVTTVSSMGILFGQRLTVQATAAQGSEHDKMVRELNNKFFFVLVALGASMIAVVVGARRLHPAGPAPPT